MKVVICGGRDFTDWQFFKNVMDEMSGQITEVSHGGAKGADEMAGKWAKENNITVTKYLADWNKYGPKAGPIRNRIMLERAKPDLVIAFPGGKGTEHCCREAKLRKIPVIRIGT